MSAILSHQLGDLIMPAAALLSRVFRQYIFRTEILLALAITLAIYTYLSSRITSSTPHHGRHTRNTTPSNGVKHTLFSDDSQSEFGSEVEESSWQLRRGNAAVYAMQGRRPKMEDRYDIVYDMDKSKIALYAVYDGHGGDFAAEYAEKSLSGMVMGRLLRPSSDAAYTNINMTEILTEEMLAVDAKLMEMAKLSNNVAGSTALLAVVLGDDLIVANVGDSRAVVCDHEGNSVQLSFDHKPHQANERKRIKQAGGFISFNGVWRVAGILATSRALGDYPLKERNLVIANPDVLTFNMRKIKPRFMILATDGLWDTFSNEEAVSFIKERMGSPLYGAHSLAQEALSRGSLDNITIMVVNFTSQNSTANGSVK